VTGYYAAVSPEFDAHAGLIHPDRLRHLPTVLEWIWLINIRGGTVWRLDPTRILATLAE